MPQWGMTVDLDRCTGCEACVVACHAENNLPIVGPEQAAMGRTHQWIRVERYWEGEFPNIRARFMPVMCQQCDAAPCEPVCPVNATYHTPDGLNAQVYNRCVGTRFCANNCPYTVRYFTWFTPEWPSPLNEQLNPDVSIRTSGIMEKCTFCVQRIRRAQDTAKDEDARRARRRDSAGVRAGVPGEGARLRRSERSRTARSRSWPTRAADIRLLEELGTRPRVVYLKEADA